MKMTNFLRDGWSGNDGIDGVARGIVDWSH